MERGEVDRPLDQLGVLAWARAHAQDINLPLFNARVLDDALTALD